MSQQRQGGPIIAIPAVRMEDVAENTVLNTNPTVNG